MKLSRKKSRILFELDRDRIVLFLKMGQEFRGMTNAEGKKSGKNLSSRWIYIIKRVKDKNQKLRGKKSSSSCEKKFNLEKTL